MPEHRFGEPADSPAGGTAIEQKNRSRYEGLTLGMAIVDTIPVVLFAAGTAAGSIIFSCFSAHFAFSRKF